MKPVRNQKQTQNKIGELLKIIYGSKKKPANKKINSNNL